MQIAENNYGRYEINAIKDPFPKGKRILSGVAGYGRFIGWLLSLCGVAICLNGVYLNRKSAILWLQRRGEPVTEAVSGKRVIELIKALAKRSSIVKPHEQDPVAPRVELESVPKLPKVDVEPVTPEVPLIKETDVNQSKHVIQLTFAALFSDDSTDEFKLPSSLPLETVIECALKSLSDFVQNHPAASFEKLQPKLAILYRDIPQFVLKRPHDLDGSILQHIVRYEFLRMMDEGGTPEDMRRLLKEIHTTNETLSVTFATWIGELPLTLDNQLFLLPMLRDLQPMGLAFVKAIMLKADVTHAEPIFAAFLPDEKNYTLEKPGALMQLLPLIDSSEKLKMALNAVQKIEREKDRGVYLQAFAKGISQGRITSEVALEYDQIEQVYAELCLEDEFEESTTIKETQLPGRALVVKF